VGKPRLHLTDALSHPTRRLGHRDRGQVPADVDAETRTTNAAIGQRRLDERGHHDAAEEVHP